MPSEGSCAIVDGKPAEIEEIAFFTNYWNSADQQQPLYVETARADDEGLRS